MVPLRGPPSMTSLYNVTVIVREWQFVRSLKASTFLLASFKYSSLPPSLFQTHIHTRTILFIYSNTLFLLLSPLSFTYTHTSTHTHCYLHTLSLFLSLSLSLSLSLYLSIYLSSTASLSFCVTLSLPPSFMFEVVSGFDIRWCFDMDETQNDPDYFNCEYGSMKILWCEYDSKAEISVWI